MTRDNVRDEDTPGAGGEPCLCAARHVCGRHERGPRVSVDEGCCRIGELLELVYSKLPAY